MDIVLLSQVLFGGAPIDVVFSISLVSTKYGNGNGDDDSKDGKEVTLFLEGFKSAVADRSNLPLLESWRRFWFWYLEIAFLTKDVLIVHGSGGELQVLVRVKDGWMYFRKVTFPCH